MPSEYDFLLPYSRSFRRVGRAVLLTSAVAVGIACTAFVIALPLRWDASDRVATSSEKPDQAWRGQKTVDAATKPKAAERTPPRPSAEMKPDKPPARADKSDPRTASKASPAPDSTPPPQSQTRSIAAPSAPTQMTESTALGFGQPRDTNAASNAPAATTAVPSSAPPVDSSRGPEPVVAATEPIPEPRPRPRDADAAPSSAMAANEEAAKQASAPKPTPPAGEPTLLGDVLPSSGGGNSTTDGSASAPPPTAPVQPSSSARHDKPTPVERTAPREKTAARTAEPLRREPERPLANQSRPRSTEAPAPRHERVSTPRESVTQDSEAEKPAARIRERSRITQDSQSRERRQATRDEPRVRTVRREQDWRRDQRRFARDLDDERDVRREFVDEGGVRHIILPRREKSRLMDDLHERTAARQGPFLFFRGPRGFFDDED
jgi:hypothetical protein